MNIEVGERWRMDAGCPIKKYEGMMGNLGRQLGDAIEECRSSVGQIVDRLRNAHHLARQCILAAQTAYSESKGCETVAARRCRPVCAHHRRMHRVANSPRAPQVSQVHVLTTGGHIDTCDCTCRRTGRTRRVQAACAPKCVVHPGRGHLRSSL